MALAGKQGKNRRTGADKSGEYRLGRDLYQQTLIYRLPSSPARVGATFPLIIIISPSPVGKPLFAYLPDSEIQDNDYYQTLSALL